MSRSRRDKLMDYPSECPTIREMKESYFTIWAKRMHGKYRTTAVQQIQEIQLNVPYIFHPYLYRGLMKATQQDQPQIFENGSFRYAWMCQEGMMILLLLLFFLYLSLFSMK